MPYAVHRKGNGYEVVKADTGEHVAYHKPPKAKAKAEKQVKLLRGIEHGWEPTGEPNTYKRRINGRVVKLRLRTGGKKDGAKRSAEKAA